MAPHQSNYPTRCNGDRDTGAGAGDAAARRVAAGRPRSTDINARLQHLLGTALSLFLEHGYSQVSLETIARHAHVAVRTIYVKFGGKAGLVQAIIAGRKGDFSALLIHIETDQREVQVILAEFGLRFVQLLTLPATLDLHRMVLAEAITTPELAAAFNRAGPDQLRDQLYRFFTRPDIAAQIRPDVPAMVLPCHLLNCLSGDHLHRLMVVRADRPGVEALQQQVQTGLRLFTRSVMR